MMMRMRRTENLTPVAVNRLTLLMKVNAFKNGSFENVYIYVYALLITTGIEFFFFFGLL